MDFLLQFEDYAIRHLNIYKRHLHSIDSKCCDTVTVFEKGAKERLLKYYEPIDFSCQAQNIKLGNKYNLQIVIPMYNAQKFICDCIKSILGQKTKYTYKIVVVDDGSTDCSSTLIAETFNSPEVTVIEQVNKGTAAARNTGFAEIDADYIMFVDADDMLKHGAIEKLLDAAYSESACIVEGGYELFANGFRRMVTHSNDIISEPCGVLWGFSWAKVIKAELLMDVCFPVGYWYEDTIISYILYTKCIKAVTINDVVYKYRRNKKGYSHKKGNDVKFLDSFWVLENIIEELYKRNISITQQTYEFILRSMITCSRRLMYMNDEIRKDVLAAFSEVLSSKFINMKANEYMLTVFERVVRNNDYEKYKKIIIGVNE